LVKPRRLCHAFGRANQHTKKYNPSHTFGRAKWLHQEKGCVNALGRANQHTKQIKTQWWCLL
jgi:hypothetical protein